MDLGQGSDYASLETGEASFYFGPDVQDTAGNDCFELEAGSRRVVISRPELQRAAHLADQDDPERYLLAGIGLLLERGILVLAPATET